MKLLDVIGDKKQRQVWWRAFRIWQRRPHELAPLKEEWQVCASCGTSFQGNYCPRCGQSAKVGRFSLKKALLLFLDVWGLGNRGMFRSIRDLMLRPGYMIRDYICGMQSAYFPPFKMFFLLAALSLVIEHGFNLTGDEENAKEDINKESLAVADSVKKELAKEGIFKDGGFTFEWSGDSVRMVQTDSVGTPQKDVKEMTKINFNGQDVEKPLYAAGLKFGKIMNTLRKKNPAIFALLTLMLFSLPLYLFFRKSPSIPNLHYPEFFVALVYTANAYSLYSILGNLLSSGIIKLIAVLMVFVALKQFSGFSKRRVLGYVVLSGLMTFIFLIIVGAVVIALTAVYYGVDIKS